jgi:CopG family nickel-responsive transcriptional regulator
MISELDSMIKKRGFASRSEIIRDAVRNYIVDMNTMEQLKGETLAVITLIYEMGKETVLKEINSIEHKYEDIIYTSTHTHFKERCIEVIITKGDGVRIKELLELITKVRGVQYVKLTSSIHRFPTGKG